MPVSYGGVVILKQYMPSALTLAAGLITLAASLMMVPWATAGDRTHQPGDTTHRFIAEKLAMWRQRLQLGEWNISVEMVRKARLKKNTWGRIRWDKGKKRAVISVMDPADYRLPLRQMLDDMEFTIVHELVHLELAALPQSKASRSSEEHAVNRLTEALLRLDRQNRQGHPATDP